MKASSYYLCLYFYSLLWENYCKEIIKLCEKKI